MDGNVICQFTAVDECTHSVEAFLINLSRHCPFPIREIQTNKGMGFTKAFTSNDPNDKNLFESKLEEYQITITASASPRRNGKVERQHHIDQLRFYDHPRIYNLEDGRRQLAVYQKKTNDTATHCLRLRSPNQVSADSWR